MLDHDRVFLCCVTFRQTCRTAIGCQRCGHNAKGADINLCRLNNGNMRDTAPQYPDEFFGSCVVIVAYKCLVAFAADNKPGNDPRISATATRWPEGRYKESVEYLIQRIWC